MYYDGKPLTDEEVLALHAHVIKAAKQLSPLGDRFQLACVELVRVADILKGHIRECELDK